MRGSDDGGSILQEQAGHRDDFDIVHELLSNRLLVVVVVPCSLAKRLWRDETGGRCGRRRARE